MVSVPLRTSSKNSQVDFTGPEWSGITSDLTSRRASFERSRSDFRMTSGPINLRGDPSEQYEKRGWHNVEAQTAPEAPSMHKYSELAEHGTNYFPQPTRWEELSPEQRESSIAGLKAHGTSLNRVSRDLGRGVDRGFARAETYNTHPFASDFYEPKGQPRKTLGRAMSGSSSVEQAAAIAMTSPQNVFFRVTQRGQVQQPNVNAAVAAAHFAEIGHKESWSPEQFRAIPGALLKARGAEVSGGGTGFHTNVRKAAYGLAQSKAGVLPEDWRGFPTKAQPEGGKGGKKPGDPGGNYSFRNAAKTSPFAGSFVDRAAPFHVADVHMASIAFPHLSGEKGTGQNINPSGASTGQKSERELALERIPHAHAAIDYAMRQAMGERGLSKTRFAQGVGWGEEQIRRTVSPEAGVKKLSYDPQRMYGWQQSFSKRTKRGTGDLYLPS